METSDLTKVIAIGGLIGAAGLFVLFIWAEWFNPKWTVVAFGHFRATIGLPAAAAAAFFVVSLFRTTDGQIKFTAPGFSFEGASGPIIMWVICFLAITLGIKKLW